MNKQSGSKGIEIEGVQANVLVGPDRGKKKKQQSP